MDYSGIIIKESLANSLILNEIGVKGVKVEKVTEGHNTAWLSQWTLCQIEVPENRADRVAKEISNSFDKEHQAWYADYMNDKFHYVIFPGKVFKVDQAHIDEYKAVREYGLSIGIADYQLDFGSDGDNWLK